MYWLANGHHWWLHQRIAESVSLFLCFITRLGWVGFCFTGVWCTNFVLRSITRKKTSFGFIQLMHVYTDSYGLVMVCNYAKLRRRLFSIEFLFGNSLHGDILCEEVACPRREISAFHIYFLSDALFAVVTPALAIMHNEGWSCNLYKTTEWYWMSREIER